MCVSGAGRGRMDLIWLAAVILELSSRSRPPAERGRAPVGQGREGGRLAGPLRAGDLGLWGEMGLKVWYYSTAERERADKAGVWTCPQSFPYVGIPVPLTVWVTVFSLGRDGNWVTICWERHLRVCLHTHGCCLIYGHFYMPGIDCFFLVTLNIYLKCITIP